MRYRELLLEYSRDATIKKWMPKLRSKILHDGSIFSLDMKWIAIGTAYQKLVTAFKVDQELQNEVDRCDAQVIEHFEDADPTRNKKYVQWLVMRYVDGGIQRLEDLDKAKEYLSILETAKSSGYFKRNPDKLRQADIGAYKTLSNLGIFVLSLEDAVLISNNKAEQEYEKEMIEDGSVEILLNTEQTKVVVPRNHPASLFYGRNTQWCTASKTNTRYFDIYSARGPLYIVLDKKTNKRWQLHFPSGQFMDENDQPIEDWSSFPMSAFRVMKLDKLDDESIFESVNAGELPQEISEELLRKASNLCLAALIFEMDSSASFMKDIPVNLTMVATGYKGYDLIDYKNDVLAALLHSSKNTNMLFDFLVEDYYSSDLDYHDYRSCIGRVAHIVGYGGHLLVRTNHKMGIITPNTKMNVNMRDKALSIIAQDVQSHADAALAYMLKKAEMLPVDD